MCWSFEVSLTTGVLVYSTALYLWSRNATGRDRWHAIFLFTFGSMQWIDAALWYLDATEDLKACTSLNNMVTRLGMYIICLEPIACLAGRNYCYNRSSSRVEWWVYFLTFVMAPWFGRDVMGRPECITFSGDTYCTHKTESNHLILGVGHDVISNSLQCWRSNVVSGEYSTEIPLVLRICFLLGMIYPYAQATPRLSGLIQCAVLTTTWMIGYMSDSHASVWCLANVAQVITMLGDAEWFPDPPVGSVIPRGKREKVYEDRFHNDKIPQNLDAIVIGSGIGGLTTGALLARAGQRVLVLEQHYRAGGCTHTFDEFGNLFDSGIHYVGAKSMLQRCLSLITDRPIRFIPQGSAADGFTYDEFDLGDGTAPFVYRKGHDVKKQDLIKRFPHEEAGIHRFFQLLKQASDVTDYWVILRLLPAWITSWWLLSPLFRWMRGRFWSCARRTATEVVNECVTDPKLRALLSAGQLIDWNCPPNKTSWWVVASMANYYKDGGFYPEGGSHLMAEAIIPIIERSGGRVLCRASVDEIVVVDGRAVGVKVHGHAANIFAPLIISDAGATNTYEKLLAPSVVKNDMKLSLPVPCAAPSNGHMTAFVNLDAPHNVFGLRPANIHSWMALKQHNWDASAMQEALYKSPLTEPDCLVTLTCPSAKDPGYRQLFPNVSNVLLLTEAKWAWFENFESGNHGKRTNAYAEFKKYFEELFLKRLYRYYPLCEGHVTSVEIGTPLSTEYYLEARQGASYGLEWTPERFSPKLDPYLMPVTRLPGLLLTGEASLFGGLCGAMVSGYVTAFHALGWMTMIQIMLMTKEQIPEPTEDEM